MATQTLSRFFRLDTDAPEPQASRSGFRLMRYVVVASLIALAVFAPILVFSEYLEEQFFAEVQQAQLSFFEEVQTGFIREQDETRQNEILKVHEAGHVNLAHVFANMLWDETLSPFVKKAQLLPIDHCRALPDSYEGSTTLAATKQSCLSKVRQAIMALPRFAEIDATVRSTMRKSSVFKIKVFDLRGLTVYSSEHAQIGEDKADTAAGGHAASEMTHRARFSAFEGVVEDRDLISSYIPVLAENNRVLGVFEIYSDVTAFLKASGDASAVMTQRIADNRATAAWVARKNLDRVTVNNGYAQAITLVLFGLFYTVLLRIAFNGQRILDRQALAQAEMRDRERFWYREKMTALATMAANVSHEVGNPLATIAALAEDIEDEMHQSGISSCQPKKILEQTDRIVSMTRQIVSFATVRDKDPEPVDVNQMVMAVCDFLGFDHRFRSVRIETKLANNLPAQIVIPDHLNEALMILLQICLEKNLHRPASQQRILVETLTNKQDVLIRFVFDLTPTMQFADLDETPPDQHFEVARRRLSGMGGYLSANPSMIQIRLQSAPPVDASHLSQHSAPPL
jgi:hypothetical protein